MTARSLAVRARHAGSAAAAAAIARRVSGAPMFGIDPNFFSVAGFVTSKVAPLSAALQLPSMKHSSRSSVGSLSFTDICLNLGGSASIARSIVRPQASSAFENRGDAHAARGANRNQPPLGLRLVENLRQRGDNSCTGGRERMTDGEAASLHVQFGAVDRAQRARQLQLVAAIRRVRPGLQST